MRAAFDDGLEVVGFDEHVEDVERDSDRAFGRQRAARNELAKIFAFDVLHRDVEVAFALADIENLRHAAAGFALGELVLEGCAAALGGDDVQAVAVSARVDQLEADLAIEHGIVGEKHAAHAPAGELTNDLIAAEEFGIHDFWLPGFSVFFAFFLRLRFFNCAFR